MDIPPISPDDLKDFMKNAVSDEEQLEKNKNKGDGPFDGKDKDELLRLVIDVKDILYSRCDCPQASKMMIMCMLVDLANYHEKMYEHRLNKDKDPDSANAWANDEGKLLAAHTIVSSVALGGSDFVFQELKDGSFWDNHE